MISRNSLKITQDDFGQANVLGIPIQLSGGNRIEIKNNIYDLTPEMYKVLSSTSYNVKTMKSETNILMMNNIINDLDYSDVGDKSAKNKYIFHKNTS